jgi:integration host factor subunit beta
MTKSELIDQLAAEQPQLAHRDVELAVNGILDCMSDALTNGDRIEVRGFGSLSLHHRPSRIGRNPKTGEAVHVPQKYVPHFKPGRELRERVDQSLHAGTPLTQYKESA